jgi:prevent-host-death family protein
MNAQPDRISVTDIRRRAGDVLARVAAGESFTVMRDGHPVAVLTPVSGAAAARITATYFVQNLAAVLASLPVVITDHARAVAELRAPDAINEPA